MPERVVVTGIGVVSPLGSLPAFWQRLGTGETGIAPVADAESAPPHLEARAREWNAREHVRPALLRRMDRCSQMIVSASRMALTDAGLALAGSDADAAGIVVGTAFGNVSESEEFVRGLFAKGPGLVNPLTFPNLVLNAPGGYVAIELGFRGPNLTVVRGEASGEAALATAYDTIVTGQADALLAGGGDELAPIMRDMYRDLRLLSPDDGGPEWSSPFDRRRNGFVMGEGTAMLVLESERHAAARGARVLAELAGHVEQAIEASPHDWPSVAAATAVEPTRRGLAALGVPPSFAATTPDAGLLVVSAANSTRALDAAESARLTAILDGAGPAIVTSLKGAIGEFGSAGALGAAAAVLAIAHGDVPRMGRLEAPDPGCTLTLADAAATAPRGGFHTALVSATPRGGGAIVLVFRRP